MEAKIISLKERLQYIGTRDLLGMIGTHFLTFANDAKGIAEQSDIFSKTKLSSLLEKDEEQPYPWVCNLHDFENIIDILNYLKKTPVDFIKYIVWRIQNHSRILSSDELDVIEGYFLDDKIRKANGKGSLFFPPNGPSLIDKIYYDNHGIPYDFPIGNAPVTKWPKVGRNDPCPCGSMKKYKKCCLGKE